MQWFLSCVVPPACPTLIGDVSVTQNFLFYQFASFKKNLQTVSSRLWKIPSNETSSGQMWFSRCFEPTRNLRGEWTQTHTALNFKGLQATKGWEPLSQSLFSFSKPGCRVEYEAKMKLQIYREFYQVMNSTTTGRLILGFLCHYHLLDYCGASSLKEVIVKWSILHFPALLWLERRW